MTLLFLIRHGLTDATGKRLTGWTPGVHLSERGREQAAALAERLRPVPLRAVYSSPIERCRETAEPIAATKGLRVSTLEGVGEVRYGSWTNRPLAQLARTRLWRRIQQAPSSVRFPDGETLGEVQGRAIEAVERIVAEHPRAAVALVSHGDVIRLLLAYFAGVHLDLFQRIVIEPTSISIVAAGDGAPRILRTNDTGTLEGFGRVPRRRKVRG